MAKATYFRTTLFWLHLSLGIGAGIAGAIMAGTAVIMAFADSYLDIREKGKMQVENQPKAEPLTLQSLLESIRATYPDFEASRIGISKNANRAYEFYYDKDGLFYANPYTGELQSSDSVPLRRTLHKGVEQWHRFLGLSGEP